MNSASIWLEAVSPKTQLTMQFQILLTSKLLLESSILLTALETKQKKITVQCNDPLTIRAFLKIVEYCWNQDSEPLTASALGIFGTAFLEECLAMARYFDLNLLIQQLKLGPWL